MACPICSWTPGNRKYPFVSETRFWRMVLAPNQALVGRCVLHLKRHAGDLADLNENELLDWLAVVRRLEAALRSSFNAAMINWSCYMNHAFREAVPDPHIHWWAVPRYASPVTVGGWTFEDPDFGNPYDHYRWLELPAAIHQEIAERIALAINSQPLDG